MNKISNKEKGKKGEEIAKNYLIAQGYKIVETNWHYSKNAELDIIALKNKTLVFVEVKTRTNLNTGHPFEAINEQKLQKLRLAINGYLQTTKQKFTSYRCDSIAIIGFETPKIEHLENICFN